MNGEIKFYEDLKAETEQILADIEAKLKIIKSSHTETPAVQK